VDDPQILPSAAAVNFEKLAQSGGVNPGYDPKAKFAGLIRDNLFLLNCNLSAPYDGLSAGANPYLVAWSQDGNFRQFGSFNANPELIGSGYNLILNDFGHITGFVSAGMYGIVAQERAFVRIDGPPYQFRTIVSGAGTRFPNALRAFDGDVYGWGPAGPFVLRGGEAPIVYLGKGKVVRTLIDNGSSFSTINSIIANIDISHVSLAIDPTNRLLQYCITSRSRLSTGLGTINQAGNLLIWYNLDEDRFSFAETPITDASGAFEGLLYLCNRPEVADDTWMPGRTCVAVVQLASAPAGEVHRVGIPVYASALVSMTFEKPYIALSPDNTTRVIRVRPIYGERSDDDAEALPSAEFVVSVAVSTKNKPNDPAYTVRHFEQDTHGWVTLPTSAFGDFHAIELTIGDNTQTLSNIMEVSALEVEYQDGPRYAA
jgi:hypothetical protein